jgi:hypothetical protein
MSINQILYSLHLKKAVAYFFLDTDVFIIKIYLQTSESRQNWAAFLGTGSICKTSRTHYIVCLSILPLSHAIWTTSIQRQHVNLLLNSLSLVRHIWPQENNHGNNSIYTLHVSITLLRYLYSTCFYKSLKIFILYMFLQFNSIYNHVKNSIYTLPNHTLQPLLIYLLGICFESLPIYIIILKWRRILT